MPISSPATGERSRFHRRLLCWSFVWGVAAVLHVTQAIWTSGGANYPGDLDDGRFNQLVLEHGFQALRGFERWSSPTQFYPVHDTLGYSDTHAGTLPIYAALREIGLSIERAWQGWFVVVAALNTLAGFRLLGALGIGGFLRGPLVFAATASATMVWLTGTHMQMLPMFAGLLAATEVVRWAEDREPRRLLAASGWFAWQFACAPYVAFFGAVVACAVAGVLLAAGWRWGAAAVSPRVRPSPTRADWLGSALVAAAGWTLAAAAGWAYGRVEPAGALRSMAQVNGFAPPPSAWFCANPVALFRPFGWLTLRANAVDAGLFGGLLLWAAAVAALVVGIRQRRTPRGRTLLALSLGVVLVIMFFTRWTDRHPGAWVAVARHVEVLRAFRFSGRVSGWLQVSLVGAAGLLLADWQSRRAGRVGLATVAACLIALEGLAWHQPGVALAAARARSDAMIAAWHRAGDRPVLAYAPGNTSQRVFLVHLDAWSAALRLHRVTINGYSGGMPASHERFFWHPTAENARKLLAALAIPANDVSLVETLDRPSAPAPAGPDRTRPTAEP